MLVPWLSVSLRAFGTSINRTALDKISKKFDKVQKSKIRYMNREVRFAGDTLWFSPHGVA